MREARWTCQPLISDCVRVEINSNYRFRESGSYLHVEELFTARSPASSALYSRTLITRERRWNLLLEVVGGFATSPAAIVRIRQSLDIRRSRVPSPSSDRE